MRLVFEITSNEIKKSKEIGNTYYLYLVRDIGGKPQINIVKNFSSAIGSSVKLEPSTYTGELII